MAIPRLELPEERDVSPMHQMTLPKRQEAVDATLLPELINLYLADRKQKNAISAKTEHNYRNHLAPFLTWFDRQESKQLSPERFTEFMRWMQEDFRNERGEHPAYNSRAHTTKRLRTALAWCYVNNCTGGVNMAEWVPYLRIKGSRLFFPETNEMQRLFDVVQGTERVRDWSLFSLLLSTGARLDEVTKAEVGNITFSTPITNLRVGDDHRGHIWLRKVKFDSQGEGEGREVVFCKDAGLLLKVWLRFSDKQSTDTIYGLSGSGISTVIRRAAVAAGFPDISPHAFRRMFADNWDAMHGEANRLTLKRQLGHSIRGDVTEDHYLKKNHRRRTAEIMKWHVSPMQHIQIDWSKLPVHVD